MEENKSEKLPEFDSLDELVRFFETHDLGKYWEQMPEAHFDIDIRQKRHIFTLDEEIADRLTEIARTRNMSSEALINAWLREKVLE